MTVGGMGFIPERLLMMMMMMMKSPKKCRDMSPIHCVTSHAAVCSPHTHTPHPPPPRLPPYLLPRLPPCPVLSQVCAAALSSILLQAGVQEVQQAAYALRGFQYCTSEGPQGGG